MSALPRTGAPDARPRADGDVALAPRPLGLVGRAVVALIGVWRWTSAWRAPRCRFRPTCSAYAVDSIRAHGLLIGGWRALRRLARCHPWNPGGYDPVT